MTPDTLKRKLTTILSADVKGYSRLMGEDEEWTLRTLNNYKGIIRNLVGEHRGRVVASPGDNVLAEFASVVDAVECAVEIQQVLKAKNAILPETRKMEFRIGINLGDVIEEEDSIYGDGVNIAARLEGLAEPGGICLSESAFQQIENKIPLHYDYLGEHEVKNIAKPVRVYRARIETEAVPSPAPEEKKPDRRKLYVSVLVGIALVLIASATVLYQFFLRPSAPKMEVASKEKMAFPLPDKPSIAVLPFVNMSGDPKQEFFSDGITEDIITALSKIPELFVIARNSTFTYKGKTVKVKQVSEELGVRYVLEGSVQKSGDRVRITTQLIDALSGHHLWSDRYDRDLKDLFALQDEVTIKIISAIQVELTEEKHFSVNTKYFVGKEGLDCYLKYVEGRYYLNIVNIENTKKARRIGEEMVAKTPKNPFGYFLLGRAYFLDITTWNYDYNPLELIPKTMEMAQKILSLDDSLAIGHALLCVAYCLIKENLLGIEEGKRAVALDPNSYESHYYYARSLYEARQYIESIKEAQYAIRLNPKECSSALYYLGISNRGLGRQEAAISAFKQALLQNPDHVNVHINLIDILMIRKQGKEAQAQAAEFLRRNPHFSMENYKTSLRILYGIVNEEYFERLVKAGLK